MNNQEKLINILKEIFMLDKAELDFGIYKIMNQKRKDIEQFLYNDLLPQVNKILSQTISSDKKTIQAELELTIKQAIDFGVDPETSPKVLAVKERLSQAADITDAENEVFSHLATFFKRYFDNGDFIAMRRYKEGVYAIPYAGEEVKLHWANADQYYIKTSEYLKSYRFKLPNENIVCFQLVEASTEQNNNKTQTDKERRFCFANLYEFPIKQENNELIIPFVYEQTDKKNTQKEQNERAFELIKTRIPADFAELLTLKPTEKDKTRTLLQKHLSDYTARNSFDYFIHKDLGAFLSREMDFFIKNEILFIDDLNTKSNEQFIKQLTKIKATKNIAHKIITFLAQLEDFQKKLWCKKKFIVQTDYCITLDRIPKKLYTQILDNQPQIQQWIKLFAIDEIKHKNATQILQTDIIGFSNPLTIPFLEQNQFLVLDTAFFDEKFKWDTLATIHNFDEQNNGLLINSENFQALSLLQARYQQQIKTIYIDPPYNTGNDGFAYKDNFKSSSWLAFMENRVNLSRNLLAEEGVFFASLDNNENANFKNLCDDIFDKNNFTGEMIIETATDNNPTQITVEHEYLMCYSKNLATQNVWTGTSSGAILIQTEYERLLEINRDIDFLQSNLRKFIRENKDNLARIKHYNNVDEFGVYSAGDPSNTKAGGYVFKVLHPKTNKPCAIPPNGFRFPEKTFREMILKGNIEFGKDETTIPKPKRRLSNAKELLRSIDYEDGRVATGDLLNILGSKMFNNPKSIRLIAHLLNFMPSGKKNILLDYFAGSGTSGHAVINLNREDGGKRKYILVEMGEYFETVTKPRIMKVIYSKDWKEGKPLSREGISQCFKYVRLESYEDTLNNLVLQPTQTQQQTLALNANFKEGYMLNYMLDVESRDSLLNLEWFINPFACYLNTTQHNELKTTKVDLIETFNYLLGLVVKEYSSPKEGLKIILGHTLEEENILIIWRDCTLYDNKQLNEILKASAYNPLDWTFDRIYVNGDNNIENLKVGEERWKVVLIEEAFKELMF